MTENITVYTYKRDKLTVNTPGANINIINNYPDMSESEEDPITPQPSENNNRVLLASGALQTETNEILFDNIFDKFDNYDEIKIKLYNVSATEATGRYLMKIRQFNQETNEYESSANVNAYYSNMNDFLGSSVRSNSSLATNAYLAMSNDNSNYRYTCNALSTIIITFYKPLTSLKKVLNGKSKMIYYRDSGSTITTGYSLNGHNYFWDDTTTTRPTGIRFYVSSGTFTSGTYKIYGIK